MEFLNKINSDVLLIKNAVDLKDAAKRRKDGIYLYAFIFPGCRIKNEELKENTNIFFRVSNSPEKIKRAGDLIKSSFRGEGPIDIFPDSLNEIENAGLEGFIGFGKSAEELMNSDLTPRKSLWDTEKLFLNIISGPEITMCDINREMEIIYSRMDEDCDLYFGLQMEKGKKDTDILVVGI